MEIKTVKIYLMFGKLLAEGLAPTNSLTYYLRILKEILEGIRQEILKEILQEILQEI